MIITIAVAVVAASGFCLWVASAVAVEALAEVASAAVLVVAASAVVALAHDGRNV
jgi:hypothetical protein